MPEDHDVSAARDPRTRLQIECAVVSLVVVLASAIVLWTHQSDMALLQVGSLQGAVAEVLFWGAPTFVLYIVLARSRLRVVVWGAVIAVASIQTWWSSAIDSHSTASIGPAFTFWFILPPMMLGWSLLASVKWTTGIRPVNEFFTRRSKSAR